MGWFTTANILASCFHLTESGLGQHEMMWCLAWVLYSCQEKCYSCRHNGSNNSYEVWCQFAEGYVCVSGLCIIRLLLCLEWVLWWGSHLLVWLQMLPASRVGGQCAHSGMTLITGCPNPFSWVVIANRWGGSFWSKLFSIAIIQTEQVQLCCSFVSPLFSCPPWLLLSSLFPCRKICAVALVVTLPQPALCRREPFYRCAVEGMKHKHETGLAAPLNAALLP